MMYFAYQLQSDLLDPIRIAASGVAATLSGMNGRADTELFRRTAAACEVLSRLKMSHSRPAFDISSVEVDGQSISITEEATAVTPFATLLRFRKDGLELREKSIPKVMVIAPLSGHFSTLLRSTVRTLLIDHDVYITDWHNARDIPLSDGVFGFADYVDHIIKFLEVLGPGAHLVAVCQPCVQALAAVSIMAQNDHPAQPRSMTLMAGPVDTRINPTAVNELATSKPMDWFEKNLITSVPWIHRGAGRKVYPGFIQLTAFMSMNIERHKKAYESLYNHLVNGEEAEAESIRKFYDEYCAVLDLTAEFYLETIDMVFQRALLAKGELTHRGQKVDPSAIRKTALLTVEGERDDICALGQTVAAQDLCSKIKPYMKRHHMQAGVGHYGVFSGRKWEGQIYPIVRNMILSMD